MFIEGATKRAYTTMWCIYKRLACLSRSIGSFYKEEKTTNEKKHLSIPQTLNLISVRFGARQGAAVRQTKDTFFPVMKKKKQTEITTTTKMVTQQSYFYEINIDWAKSASWVCQSTSKLVIKIIKAFFSVRPIVLYEASGILMKKSHSLACQINSATRHSRWSPGMFS